MLDAFSQTESEPTFFLIWNHLFQYWISQDSDLVHFLAPPRPRLTYTRLKVALRSLNLRNFEMRHNLKSESSQQENTETEFVPVALFRERLSVLSSVCWDCGLGLSAAIIKKDDLGLMDAIEATFVLAVFSCFSSDRVILAHFLRTTLLHDAVTVWATVLRKCISSVRGGLRLNRIQL